MSGNKVAIFSHNSSHEKSVLVIKYFLSQEIDSCFKKSIFVFLVKCVPSTRNKKYHLILKTVRGFLCVREI